MERSQVPDESRREGQQASRRDEREEGERKLEREPEQEAGIERRGLAQRADAEHALEPILNDEAERRHGREEPERQEEAGSPTRALEARDDEAEQHDREADRQADANVLPVGRRGGGRSVRVAVPHPAVGAGREEERVRDEVRERAPRPRSTRELHPKRRVGDPSPPRC